MKYIIYTFFLISFISIAETTEILSPENEVIIKPKDILRYMVKKSVTPGYSLEQINELKKKMKGTPQYKYVVNLTPSEDKIGYTIICVLTNEGMDKFRKYTEKNIGNIIHIKVNNKVVSSPTIRAPILNGKFEISGSFSEVEVKKMYPSTLINVFYLYHD